jgi:hypothetical protein
VPTEIKPKRIHMRGDVTELRAGFFNDEAHTSPIVPINAMSYPSYTIYDPDNQPIQSGVAQPEGGPGLYKIMFSVPTDATLSNDVKRWRVEWTMVSTDNRQMEFVESFDVHDIVVSASESREIKKIALALKDNDVTLRLGYTPAEVYFNLYLNNDMNQQLASGSLTGGSVRVVEDGDSRVFVYRVPGEHMKPGSTLGVVWSITPRIGETEQHVHQSISAVTPLILEQVASLRMLIDKLQVRQGLVQAYEDSDLVEYLRQGLALLNGAYTPTSFQFGFVPPIFGVHHLLFSGWWALNGQYLLAGSLDFNFSGQSVTLDTDQKGPLADTMSRWTDFLNNTLPQLKTQYVRANSAVASVSVRGYRYNSINNYTYRISSTRAGGGSTGGLLQQLTTLGLLY